MVKCLFILHETSGFNFLFYSVVLKRLLIHTTGHKFKKYAGQHLTFYLLKTDLHLSKGARGESKSLHKIHIFDVNPSYLFYIEVLYSY